MEYFAGFLWLIFSPAFQGYLQVPASGKPVFSTACTAESVFHYQVTTPPCLLSEREGSEPESATDASPSARFSNPSLVLSYFESASRRGRYLAARCSNLITRRANHTGTYFQLKKSTSHASHFHLVHEKTQQTLVVNSVGQARFVESQLIPASPTLQLRSALQIVAVRRMADDEPLAALCEQHSP